MKKKEFFNQDFTNNEGFWKRKKMFLLYPEKKQIYFFRKAQYYANSKNIFLRLLWSWKWLRMRKQGCQISLKAQIGKKLKFLHYGTRVIVGKAIIGENCIMGINVIIGLAYNTEKQEYQAPTIGNKVYIGHNSSLVGGITIGDHVLVAPNTYVNKDVPSHSIVLGNNVIIPKQNASDKFLGLGY